MSESEPSPCTLTLPDGTHYDLSSLASAKEDYEVEAYGTSYKLNVCRSVVSELWKVDDPDSVGGFAHTEKGDFSLGKVNSTLVASPSTGEPLMVLQEGGECPLNPLAKASTAIRFICSPTDFNAGRPQLVATLPVETDEACQFFFEWKSHVACPTNPKRQLEAGHYWAFGSFLLIAIITWFLGLTLYNRFYLKRRGLDQFPLPRSLPSLSLPSLRLFGRRSAEADAAGPSWGSWRRQNRNRNGYSHVRADEHDESEGFAGRFSLEDDEDDDPAAGDARALGREEADVWRGASAANGTGTPARGKTVGVHEGLIDV